MQLTRTQQYAVILIAIVSLTVGAVTVYRYLNKPKDMSTIVITLNYEDGTSETFDTRDNSLFDFLQQASIADPNSGKSLSSISFNVMVSLDWTGTLTGHTWEGSVIAKLSGVQISGVEPTLCSGSLVPPSSVSRNTYVSVCTGTVSADAIDGLLKAAGKSSGDYTIAISASIKVTILLDSVYSYSKTGTAAGSVAVRFAQPSFNGISVTIGNYGLT